MANRKDNQHEIDRIPQEREISLPARRKGEEKLSTLEVVAKRIKEWKENPNAELNTIGNWREFGQRTKILSLSGLNLTQFPEEIRSIPNVENIDLGYNLIEKLPEWFSELTSLKGINLVRNRIKELPEDINKLHELRVLHLHYNQLHELPQSIQEIELSEIRLHKNPGLRIPESIFGRPPKEIFRYYFESRADDGQPLLELKLILVGRGKAGKTTLVKSLAGEDTDEFEQETHSISIRELTLDCDKGSVRTRAWDFGGQEILHSTHQFFLTERSLYLLVLEPRTGSAQKDAEYWLKLIESQGGGSPVIIALNWSHNRKWKVDEIRLRRKFPFIVDFISTDALRGEGIEELKHSIINVVQDKMPDVWLPFPKHWRNIKNDVAGMKSNFLTYKQYTNLCKKHKEFREKAQADLAGILHALGLALYFGEDPRLHDTRVLNPGWVTGGVYAVIRSQFVEQNDGQLSLKDMKRILKEAEEQKVVKSIDYPPRTHRFILELMKAFQLCYASEEVNGKPIRYLVPELLPEFEPEMIESWEDARVRLRYRYDVLSPGLLSKFIVQTHELSENEPHWRHGVVLRHSDASALIREEQDKSELHVFVLGDDIETRNVLTAIVRRELELLHITMKIHPIEELELSGDQGQWISVKALREVETPGRKNQKLPIQPEGTALVNVSEELNKIIPLEARVFERKSQSVPDVRIFVSYAHEDERQLKRLDSILDVLEQQHGIRAWTDKRLIAGDEWDHEIRRRLEEMDIFLFIASQTSLVRPYVRDPELRRAYERKNAGEIELVTVKLEPCASDEDALVGQFQRLATKFRSVAEYSPKSVVWEQVRRDLLPVINRVKERKAINT